MERTTCCVPSQQRSLPSGPIFHPGSVMKINLLYRSKNCTYHLQLRVPNYRLPVLQEPFMLTAQGCRNGISKKSNPFRINSTWAFYGPNFRKGIDRRWSWHSCRSTRRGGSSLLFHRHTVRCVSVGCYRTDEAILECLLYSHVHNWLGGGVDEDGSLTVPNKHHSRFRIRLFVEDTVVAAPAYHRASSMSSSHLLCRWYYHRFLSLLWCC